MTARTGHPSLRERAEDVFWTRHSNPWSGWTRTATSPVLIYAIYERNWRLLGAAIAFTVVNPVLFAPPDRTDSWMSRGVLAERFWLETGHRTIGFEFPTILNTINLPVFGATIYAAIRRRPIAAAVGTIFSMALKLWFVDELIDYRERAVEHGETE